MRWIVAISLVASASVSVLGQGAEHVRGIVISERDEPVAGARVDGDLSRNPAERESLRTAENGSFAFTYPQDFVRVRADKFQPVTVFIKPGETNLRIVLTDATSTSKMISGCPAQGRGLKRVGNPFLFSLPKGTKIKRITDADTAAYRVNFPHSNYWLLLLWGVNVGRTDADERLERASSRFSERWIAGPGAPNIGIDSAGVSSRGAWRSFGTAFDQAIYVDVPDEAATYFDAIIDSACLSQSFISVLKSGKQ